MNQRHLFTLIAFFGAVGAIHSGGCGVTGDPANISGKTESPAPSSAAPTASAATSFADVTKAAGITYRWSVAGNRPLNILQTIGNGAGFFDHDGDGNLDLLLVGPKTALYRGDGKGIFTDVSAEVGLNSLKGNFLGCAIGDYDNDGYSDIYLSAYRGGALLRNRQGKGFEDVSKRAGIPPQAWGTSTAFADFNGDGLLDLYVGNYVDFGPKTEPQLCDNNGIKSACGPRFYKPIKSKLYLGGPSGVFRDVTNRWDAHLVEGKNLGVSVADFDGNGKVSLAIANDEMPGDLLHNRGEKFENIGKTSGTAYDDNGNVHGGMGIDWGDYNNDGKLDLVVATFQNETKNIYHNDGENLFTDKSAMLGMAPATPLVTFGIKWFDYDNDGYLDLILASGHVQDNISEIDKTASYKQPTMLFRNNGAERFEDVTSRIEESGRRPIVGRGLAVGDYDNDGKVDALVVDSEGTPILLHNETPDAGNAITLSLVGKKSNRDGYGARIVASVDGKQIVRRCGSDGSYLSSSDKRVHIGLGTAPSAKTVTVYWPSGKKSELKDVAPGKTVTVREPD
ncbi:MAG: CRTAC1 family protein [Capsulimonadales bacterium]|nr:CRTAC1 family protein [Capsulimonadales bacterium]